ncbi:hypothetical protein [Microvirga guangxiensis]|uniref:Uncharacterized protein n=1 Tax=Microvirga guangxiensis TaxID=549386 RepID=A0A1G5K540_9HYPH|nr:hypothetical protein [Microvirga guangxiensis]SCY95009.1 hypothetical protein SAMN02927923_03040 [Microvirga guangxiensis]
MTDTSFAETIRERIAAIEVVVDAIAEHGEDTNLRDLRILLINTMSLMRRDPGIEAAVDDLYSAARAIVKDAADSVHPVTRNVRCMRSALTRFTERVPVVAGLSEPDDTLRFRGLEAAYAVQLERSATTDDDQEDSVQSVA